MSANTNAPLDANGLPAIKQCEHCDTWKADDGGPCDVKECREEQEKKAEEENKKKSEGDKKA